MMIYKKLFLAIFLGVFVMGSPVSAAPIEDDDSFDSPEEKFKAYQVLATGGDADAQKNIGTMYDNGEGVPQDDKKAFKWYHKAAIQGNANGQYNIGLMYENGQGVDQDDTKAFKWYHKAAKQRDSDAQYNIGRRYYRGEGVDRNDKKAFKWYHKAAKQGKVEAQYQIGWRYYSGKGVDQDDTKAFKWYHKAAKQGASGAQYNCGVMYDNGEGVPQNDKKAFKWFYKAAEQGNARAQYNIGKIYLQGKGVDQDDEKALYWLLKGGEHILITDKYPPFSWKTEAFSKDLLGKTFSLEKKLFPEKKGDEKEDFFETLDGKIGYYKGVFSPEHDGVSESTGEKMPHPLYHQIFVEADDSVLLINRLKTQFNEPSFLISCINLKTRYLGKDKKTPLIRPFTIEGNIYWSLGTENIDASQKFIELMGKTFSQISFVADLLINQEDQDDENKEMVAQIKNIELYLTASQKALQEELTEGLARRNTHFLDSYSLMK